MAINFTQQNSPRHVIVAFSGLMLVMLLAALDATIVATAMPVVADQLGGVARISWVITAYLLAETVGTPLWGKFGDLYGRKKILQLAVVLFIIGSIFCGASQSMDQLIIARVVQGLGGGALMVTTQAAIGDIVAPRQRGRYQGIFGAVFGISSVAGPFIGGYFTTHLSWRGIFLINVPIGLIAMGVIAWTFPSHTPTRKRSIDYLGALLLGISIAAIVLLVDSAHFAEGWRTFAVTTLAAISLLALIAFLFVEVRVEEPVLPLRIFANRTVWVSSILSLVAGFVMFGAVTFVPLFLQWVKGETPFASGMEMLPLMAGIPVSSILAGLFISMTGRFRSLPIYGTAISAIGLFMMSAMTQGTSIFLASVYMFALGIGLGMTLQVLVIAVQNAVGYSDLGVATSSGVLFRFIGGSLGTAILGAVFTAGVAEKVTHFAPEDASVIQAATGPEGVKNLPERLRELRGQVVAEALDTTFGLAGSLAVFGFAIAWLLPAMPLRHTIAAAHEMDVGESAGKAMAMPTDSESADELQKGLAILADRDVKEPSIESLLRNAGIELSPAAACLLLTLRPSSANANMHSVVSKCSANATAAEELKRRALIEERIDPEGKSTLTLTPDGDILRQRLKDIRLSHLDTICEEFNSSKQVDVSRAMHDVASKVIES